MRRTALLGMLLPLVALSGRAARPDSLSAVQECKFSLRSSLTGAVSGIVINAALTEVLKDNIRERRPDGNDNHSFPSRHTSYAFTFASVSSHELCRFSPLWVSASHTIANAVAMQRVYAGRHYPGDVLAGAALGVASTELGYCLSRWIFPSDRCPRPISPAGNSRGLTTSTTALISFGSRGDGLAAGCGVESSLGLSFPVTDAWGLGASLRMRSQTVYLDGEYAGGLNGAGVAAGVYVCRAFGYWQADATASVGILYNFDRPLEAAPAVAPVFDLTAAIVRSVARGLSIGPRLGLDITKRPSALCALTVSLVAKAEF